MMEMMQDFCSGAFEQHMAGGGDPMDAFDAVGSAIDGLMAPFPNDMPCADMAADFPPMPPDMGAFMDGYPPYGDFPGGEAFDPGAMPDTWEPGPMTDMGTESRHGRQSRFRTKPRYGTESRHGRQSRFRTKPRYGTESRHGR